MSEELNLNPEEVTETDAPVLENTPEEAVEAAPAEPFEEAPEAAWPAEDAAEPAAEETAAPIEEAAAELIEEDAQTAVEEAAATVEEATEPAVEEAAASVEEAAESMEDHRKELDSSMRALAVGDLIDGTVAGISDSEVTVDLQYFAEGVIRFADWTDDPSVSIKEDVHPGEAVKAKILRMDDGNGNLLLSRKEAVGALSWDHFREMIDSGEVFETKITGTGKGVVITYLDGIRAFIPASHAALSYVEDLESLVGKTFPAQVIEANAEKKRLVLSIRNALLKERDAEKARLVSNMEVGTVTEGTVESLQSYGAFVNLGNGVDGLVHISQITNTKRLSHPKEMLKVGDRVKVRITKIADGKISLSMKALEDAASVPIEEERVEIPKGEALTTNLGDLLSGLKLD